MYRAERSSQRPQAIRVVGPGAEVRALGPGRGRQELRPLLEELRAVRVYTFEGPCSAIHPRYELTAELVRNVGSTSSRFARVTSARRCCCGRGRRHESGLTVIVQEPSEVAVSAVARRSLAAALQRTAALAVEHLRHEQQVRAAVVDAGLAQQRRELAAVMRLVIEEMRDDFPERRSVRAFRERARELEL